MTPPKNQAEDDTPKGAFQKPKLWPPVVVVCTHLDVRLQVDIKFSFCDRAFDIGLHN